MVAAERRVAAAFDRVGEAKAAQLPRISLTAGGSNVSSELIVLKDASSPVWSLGANLIAPIYQGGALRAQVEIRSAEQKQAVAEYARAGQKAFGEVESALGTESILRERDAILAGTVRDNEEALELTRIQFRVGTVDLRSGRAEPAVALCGAHRAAARADRATGTAHQSVPGVGRRLRPAGR